MKCCDITMGVKRRSVAAHFNLQIARAMAGVEWSDEGKHSIDDRVATGQHGEAQSSFLAGRPKIENAIFSKSRGEHFWIIVIETESVTMQCIADLVTVAEKL